jgi:glycosyltransferase involved in cell wall biosynthesis
VLPVSRFLQHAIERYSIRARFTVVPNVVDTSLFSPAAHSPARGEPKRLLFVGGLAGIKGLTYLLAALAQLRGQREDWRLDVVGDGPLRTEHERTTRELGLFDRIVFHGHRSPEEVAGLMREADFLVSPSLVETFSVVAAEALASGIPVLATRSGGPEEFVTEDVGLLVPTGDVNALCSGIVYMLDHAHNYSPERIAAYARARFSPEIVGATLHELYCSLQK